MTRSALSIGEYQRIDTSRLTGPAATPAMRTAPAIDRDTVRARVVLPLSLLLCVVITVLTVLAANVTGGTILAATLIPVTAYGVLVALVLVGNPLLRAITAGRTWLSRREVMCIFAAMLVCAGIPGYGMAHQLVPILAAPHNPDWATPQRGWTQELHPHLPEALFVQDQAAVQAFYEGRRTDAHGTPLPAPEPNASIAALLDHSWQVARAMNWSAWVRPLLIWGVFLVASYALFYSLVYLVLPSWSQREKLIFPLAKIPEALLPERGGRAPAVLRDLGFWIAFGVVFAVLSYNAMVHAQLIVGLEEVSLGMARGRVRALLADTPLERLTQSAGQMPSLMLLVTFTVMGIAFLLPVETSFSIWSYYLAGLGIILVLTWLGYGQALADFPSEWYWQNNPVTALGAGALLVFAAVMLTRALMDYRHHRGRQASWMTLKLGGPGLVGVVSAAALWVWLSWAGLPVLWAGLLLAVTVLIMTGLMRMVAEAGVFWTQLHVSFFHLYRTFGLGRWLSPTALLPMVPMYWVLYLDVKAFAGSNLLNAGKLEQDTATDEAGHRQGEDHECRRGRRIFHLNLILCMGVVVVLSLVLLLVLTHVRGGYQMNGWFFSVGPPSMLDQAVAIATSEPTIDWSTAMWYAIGGGYLLLTLRLRRSIFCWPHPIGLLMLCNPLMAQLWFSFFLGWLCKRLVVAYGGKTTFDKTRGIFLGIIVGELLAVLLWTMLGLVTDLTPHLTLNRHG